MPVGPAPASVHGVSTPPSSVPSHRSSDPASSDPRAFDPRPAAPAVAAPGARRAPGRNGRLTGVQLLVSVILFLVVETLISVIAVVWTVVTSGAVPDPSSGFGVADFDPTGFLVAAVIGAVLAITGHILVVGPIGARPGQAVGGRGKLAELAAGLGIGSLLIALSTGIIALLGGYRVTGLDPNPQLLAPLAIGIFAAFVEEVFFRGALLRLIDGWLGSWAALALTSVLFGLVHITNDDAGLWGAIAIIIEAGVLLGGAYLLTRRLWLAIGIHLAWNTVQSGIFSFAVSGTGEQHGILQAQLSGPDWLSGGAMGVEGSVVTVIVGLAAGIVMVVLAHRRGNLLPRDRRADRPLTGADGTVPNA